MLRCLARHGRPICRQLAAAVRQGLTSGRELASLNAIREDNTTAMHVYHSKVAGVNLLQWQLGDSWGRGFASEAGLTSDQSVQAKPIKKGLSAGTVPPATEQVPPGAPAHQETKPARTDMSASSTGSSETHSNSATVGKDRPSASAIPAGVDQVPPSSKGRTASQPAQGSSSQGGEPSTSHSQPQQSMHSVLNDIGDIGQLGKAQSKPSGEESSKAAISRWQRFQWWIWGTPQEYWTGKSSHGTSGSTAETSNADSDAGLSSNSDAPGRKKKWQRSKYTLGDIIGPAILRSGITKDEDIARFASKSAAIAIYTLAGFSLLGTLGVDTKPLVAGLGVGGFTVGFALRDVATNFVSGVLLVLQRPFEKGNRLRVHAGSTVLEGDVQSIELRYIVLKPKDGSTVMIPASIVYANPVVVLKQ